MTADILGAVDELEEYLAEQMQDPSFRTAYYAAECRITLSSPRPLPIDGREYRRRRRGRKR